MTTKRKERLIRLNPELDTRLVARVKAEELNVNEAISCAIAEWVANQRPVTPRVKVDGYCAHPRTERENLGYAVRCLDCGRVIPWRQ